MSIFKIAYRNMWQRRLASCLTLFTMSLGVMLVVVVLSTVGVVERSFHSNSNLGYNMIVGAKGGSLQLTLNSVFYLLKPIENVPYSYYLEFLPAEERQVFFDRSLAAAARQTQWKLARAQAASSGMGGLPADIGLTDAFIREQMQRNLPRAEDGRFNQFVDVAIPLCLGDYLEQFRVVGTTPDFFNKLKFGEMGDRTYEFEGDGRNFVHYSQEHGFFEAVIGADVARSLQLKAGDKIAPNHGTPDGHAHQQKFTIVGVLTPTTTPNDRAVFVNMEGFFLMDDHAKPVKTNLAKRNDQMFDDGRDKVGKNELSDADDPASQMLPLEQREVTAILVRTKSPIYAVGMQGSINEPDSGPAQAVTPVSEIYSLFSQFVGPIQRILLVLTFIICLVSGISILVSIYNSMNDRRQEIAVMRALGAARSTVMTIILLEAMMLAVGGGLLGWCGGHLINHLSSPLIEARTGVSISFFDFAPPIDLFAIFQWEGSLPLLQLSPEILLLPGLMVLAILVGLLPGFFAYQTDVAKSLAK